MPFSNLKLIKDIRNARKVFWWNVLILLIVNILPGFGLILPVFIPIYAALVILLILFSYIIFVGFSKIAKHFHNMGLFSIIVIAFILDMFLNIVSFTETIMFYGGVDPYKDIVTAIALLTDGILAFIYAYYIMMLPQKFGNLLIKVRISNIGAAFGTTLSVLLTVLPPENKALLILLETVVFVCYVLFFASYYYDYVLLGKTLKLIGGVAPTPAPLPLPQAPAVSA
jgi:hypothetical protein